MQYFAYFKIYTSEILGLHNGVVVDSGRTEPSSSYGGESVSYSFF